MDPAPAESAVAADTAPPPAPPAARADAGAKFLTAALSELGPAVVVLAALCVTLPGVMGLILMGHAAASGAEIAAWLRGFGLVGVVLFTAGFALATGSAVLPTYALSFASGVFFGWAAGSAVALAGITAGALVGYGWGVLLARRRVMSAIERHPRASVIRSALIDRGFGPETFVVGLLRFPPNSPFALTNLVMASTGVRLPVFVVGTALGMATRTLIAVWFGVAAGSLVELRNVGWPWKVAGIIVMAAVVLVVYRLFTRWSKSALDRHMAAAGAA